MRLIGYGLGEILDRLTILDLKLAHGGGASFATERTELLKQLHTTQIGQWFEEALQLATINGLLWRAEDDLRYVRVSRSVDDGLQVPDILRRVADIAFRIQELNDQRAALVKQINGGVQEKL